MPYPVDWRFLPEPALLIKDAARHALVKASNVVALSSSTRRLWASTFGRRTLDAIHRAGIVFIHIPKTGGTSVCACLYGRNLPHYTRTFYAAVYGEEITRLPSFSLVRDPVDRLHSAYRFMRAGGTELMATSRFERALLPVLRSFAAFVGLLVEHPELIDRFLFMRRQTEFIVDQHGQLQVDRVFLLDRNGKLPSGIASYLGVDQLPHLNASPSATEAVSAELRIAINAIYAADCRLIEQVRRQSGMLSVADWVASDRQGTCAPCRIDEKRGSATLPDGAAADCGVRPTRRLLASDPCSTR